MEVQSLEETVSGTLMVFEKATGGLNGKWGKCYWKLEERDDCYVEAEA